MYKFSGTGIQNLDDRLETNARWKAASLGFIGGFGESRESSIVILDIRLIYDAQCVWI